MKSKLLLSGVLTGSLLLALSGCSPTSEPSAVANISSDGNKSSSSPASSDGDLTESSITLSDQQRNPYEIITPQCGGAGSAVPNIAVSSEGFTTDPSGNFAFKSTIAEDGTVEAAIINLNGLETQSGTPGASAVYNSGVIKIADIPEAESENVVVNILANGQDGSPSGKTELKDSYQAYEGADGISPVDYIGYHDFNADTPDKIESSGCGSIIWHDNRSVYIAMLGNDYVKLNIGFTA